MKLAIFDIDGTLTRTNTADQICYMQTAAELLGAEKEDFDPESFTHFTDACMADELWRRHKGAPMVADLVHFQQVYFSKLKENYRSTPHLFSPLLGAADILARLAAAGWAIALATGCWRESAEMKLRFSGVGLPHDVPMGTSSDAYSREGIVRHALAAAQKHYSCANYNGAQENQAADFEKVVYIGDGIWDLRTCANLGLPFVGVRAEEAGYEGHKSPLGDFLKLGHYQDFEAVQQALHQAIAPVLNY